MAGQGVRVLVADDEPGVRTVMAEALQAAGYEAVQAGDPGEALRLMTESTGLAMVVTDIEMPGFGGFDVATQARARNPRIPILFVTDQPDRVTDRTTAAPCYCLSRPFTAAVLVEVVDRLLHGCRDTGPLS